MENTVRIRAVAVGALLAATLMLLAVMTSPQGAHATSYCYNVSLSPYTNCYGPVTRVSHNFGGLQAYPNRRVCAAMFTSGYSQITGYYCATGTVYDVYLPSIYGRPAIRNSNAQTNLLRGEYYLN